MILDAIANHLRNPTTGDTSNPVRQTARRRFNHLAGHHVYRGRIPESPGVKVAVAVRLVDGGEIYELAREAEIARPVVEFLIVGTDPYARQVTELADCIRRIFSGINGQEVGGLWIHGATWEFSSEVAPRLLGDGSDRWSHAFAIDAVFSVAQIVA